MPAKTTDSIGLNVRLHGAVNRGAASCFTINSQKNASHETGVFYYGFDAFTSLVPQLALPLQEQRQEQERRQERR
ncbi:MAG: hypothetical protein ACKO15_10670, partial [Burkholderiales bacterium]